MSLKSANIPCVSRIEQLNAIRSYLYHQVANIKQLLHSPLMKFAGYFSPSIDNSLAYKQNIFEFSGVLCKIKEVAPSYQHYNACKAILRKEVQNSLKFTVFLMIFAAKLHQLCFPRFYILRFLFLRIYFLLFQKPSWVYIDPVI